MSSDGLFSEILLHNSKGRKQLNKCNDDGEQGNTVYLIYGADEPDVQSDNPVSRENTALQIIAQPKMIQNIPE